MADTSTEDFLRAKHARLAASSAVPDKNAPAFGTNEVGVLLAEVQRERERAEAAEHALRMADAGGISPRDLPSGAIQASRLVEARDTARREAIEEAIGVAVPVPLGSCHEPHPRGFHRGVLAYRAALRALLAPVPSEGAA